MNTVNEVANAGESVSALIIRQNGEHMIIKSSNKRPSLFKRLFKW